MSGLVFFSTSSKGKTIIIDKNYHRYSLNNSSVSQKYWRCSNRSCSARLITRVSTDNLCVPQLPEHSHGNQLLKQMAKKVEHYVIKEMSKHSHSTRKLVLQEISQSCGSKGLMSSVSSAGSIKMSLWREKQKINPRPAIPNNHFDFMKYEMPVKYSRTADGGDFLLKKAWIDEEEEHHSMTVFLSDWGANLLRTTHSTWFMDAAHLRRLQNLTLRWYIIINTCIAYIIQKNNKFSSFYSQK